MFCSIFLQFFSVNLVRFLICFLGEGPHAHAQIMYAVALHCCGWSWGVFQASVVSYASEITPVALRGYLTVSRNHVQTIVERLDGTRS